MEYVNLFIYDFMANLLPGAILNFFLLSKYFSLFGIYNPNCKEFFFSSTLNIIIFLFSSYIIGNGLNTITRLIFSTELGKEIFFLREAFSSEKDIEKRKKEYEIAKNKYVQTEGNRIIFLKYEAKYLFFRNTALAMILVVVLRLEIALKNEILIYWFIGIIICLIKFRKYWNMSGDILERV